MMNSIKEIKNDIASTGNRANQMEERTSDSKDRNLEGNAEGRRERLELKKIKKI